MARSGWKLIYFSQPTWRKIMRIKKKKRVKRRIIFDRSSFIPMCFISHLLRIHKGKKFRRFVVNKLSVGKKIGEFSFTRKPYHFPVRKSKKKKNFLRR